MNLWLCPRCNGTDLALAPFLCYGGTSIHPWNSAYQGQHGYREDNIRALKQLFAYSRETANAEAYEYHLRFMSEHTEYK
jgi:hypothetical protein